MLSKLGNLQASLKSYLRLLQELVSELISSRPYLFAMNLDAVYLHVERELYLCHQLQQVRLECAAACGSVAQLLDVPPDLNRVLASIHHQDEALARTLTSLYTEIHRAESQVDIENRIHGLLINGTRRTLAVLANAFASVCPSDSFVTVASGDAGVRTQP